MEELESLGAECLLRPPKDRGTNHFEVKFRGPDGVGFDIDENRWPGSAPVQAKTTEHR